MVAALMARKPEVPDSALSLYWQVPAVPSTGQPGPHMAEVMPRQDNGVVGTRLHRSPTGILLARDVRRIAKGDMKEGTGKKLWCWMYLTFTAIRDVSLEEVPRTLSRLHSCPPPEKSTARPPRPDHRISAACAGTGVGVIITSHHLHRRREWGMESGDQTMRS